MSPAPTFFGIPLNRVVAFAGPYVSIASGIAATWLTVHVHVLTVFHLTQSSIAGELTQAAIFGISTGVTWLGHSAWLKGHHILLANQAPAASINIAPARASTATRPSRAKKTR
jgi:hypothetical protein